MQPDSAAADALAAVETVVADLSVDILVPNGYDAPRKIEPHGATWSASQSVLRWTLPAVAAGASGVFVAAFKARDGSEAAAAGLSRCRAVLRLRGEGNLWLSDP